MKKYTAVLNLRGMSFEHTIDMPSDKAAKTYVENMAMIIAKDTLHVSILLLNMTDNTSLGYVVGDTYTQIKWETTV